VRRLPEKMKNLSIVLDQETLDRIVKLQKKNDIFSRSSMIRTIVKKGIKEIEKTG